MKLFIIVVRRKYDHAHLHSRRRRRHRIYWNICQSSLMKWSHDLRRKKCFGKKIKVRLNLFSFSIPVTCAKNEDILSHSAFNLKTVFCYCVIFLLIKEFVVIFVSWSWIHHSSLIITNISLLFIYNIH